MSKRPSFQFYPPDWRNDAGVRLCSIAARGLWIDMLCLMHEGEPYGHLTTKGRPMRPEELAKLVGESVAAVKRWLAELREQDVFSETGDGVIYSRRMVRDERIREARAQGGHAGGEHGVKGASHGKRGGRPPKAKGGSGGEDRGDKKPPLEPPPSSSSPSPESSEDKSSAQSADVVRLDPDAAMWDLGVRLLVECGGETPQGARKFLGMLLRDERLLAKDLLPVVSSALANQTRDPKSYLRRGAQGVAQRRVTAAEPKRQGFV